MKNSNNQLKGISSEEKITRKEAIKKAGITALTAASLLFLSTQASSAQSAPKSSKPIAPRRR